MRTSSVSIFEELETIFNYLANVCVCHTELGFSISPIFFSLRLKLRLCQEKSVNCKTLKIVAKGLIYQMKEGIMSVYGIVNGEKIPSILMEGLTCS